MELQRGIQRWVVDISQWNPSPSEFSYATSFLPQHEHHSITRDPDNPRHLLRSALAFDDSPSLENSRSISEIGGSKRAIVSRLLQYALVHEVFGIPFDEIIIKRTVEGKPYLEWNKVDQELPNFNFNASHHGDYVAIASEPLCIVGLDIVSLTIPGKETIPEFIQNFSSYFSRLEWNSIVNASSCDDMLTEFYRYWCVKEAFVKAIGTGVGYRLDSVEFHHTRWTNISVKLDGRELKEWRFWLYDFGKRHMVSIARGHPRIATETYKRTLKRTEFDEEQYHLGLHLPNVSFVQRTVEQLIPVSFKSGGNIGQEHDTCQAEEIGNSKP